MTRRYNDLEVARILTRMAELQSAAPLEMEPHGLTQAELESIAREAGLDPAHVQVAIAELETGEAARESVWLGGALWIRLERSLPGELPEREYEALIDIVQNTLNEVGQPSVLGRTLRWHSVNASSGRHGHGREIEVAVSTRRGRTAVRVQEKLRGLATNLFASVIAGGGSSSAMLAGAFAASALGPIGAVGIGGAAVAGSYALARALFRWKSRSRAEQLRKLADRLAEHVVATAVSVPAVEEPAPPARLGRGDGGG